jgi:hypothetical protein
MTLGEEEEEEEEEEDGSSATLMPSPGEREEGARKSSVTRDVGIFRPFSKNKEETEGFLGLYYRVLYDMVDRL